MAARAAERGVYTHAPAGALPARAAVAAELPAAGQVVAPERVLLTASSSESYAFLFKLLCDPGDVVLVPEPSYPLFEYLARLEGATPVPSRLAYDGVWHVDFASVDEALARAAGRARALVVVSPNNPTGSFLKRGELPPLAARCEAHGLAVISDEVFALYGAGTDAARVAALAAETAFTDRVLTFALGGLSKACGMPQLKLGWTIVAGPPSAAAAAMARLELVADTYLSVSAPVQAAAARLLALGRGARRAIAARVEANRAHLARALPASSPCSVLASEGAGRPSCACRPRAPTRSGRARCSTTTASSYTPDTFSTSTAARSSCSACCRRQPFSPRARAACWPAAPSETADPRARAAKRAPRSAAKRSAATTTMRRARGRRSAIMGSCLRTSPSSSRPL